MKKIVLLFFLGFNLVAQTNTRQLDSVRQVAYSKRAPIDTKIAALLYLGVLQNNYGTTSSIQPTETLYQIARKYKKNIAYGHYFFLRADFFMINGEYAKAKYNINKALPIYEKYGSTNHKITAYYTKIFALDFQGQFKAANALAHNTVKKFESLPNNSKISEIYYYLSTVFNENKQPQSAFEYINKAMTIYRKEKNTNGILKCQYQIASIFFLNRMYDKAETYINSLYQKNNKDLLKKIEYKLTITELRVYIYLALKKYKQALPYAEEFLNLSKKLNNPYYRFIPQFRLAETYCGLNKYTEAFSILRLIDENQLNDAEKIGYNYVLGKIHFGLQDYTKSNFYFQKNYNAKPDDVDYIKSLAEVSVKLKNYPKAYQLLEECNAKEIALLNKEKNSQVADYESLYQVNEKNLELKNKELELSKAQLEVQNRNNFIRNLVVVLSFVTLLLVLSLFIYFSKKRVTQILARKNTQLEGTNQLLQKSLQEKEILLKEIHHRVKNNLQIVMSLLNIQAQNKNQINIETFLENSRSRIATMALVHQNLYLSDSVSSISFKEYIQELTEYIKSSYDKEKVTITILSEEVTLDIDTAIPLGLIINELVSNALKYAFTDDSVQNTIQIEIQTISPQQFSLTIADNGIGIPTQVIKKSKSIGLELVELLVLQLRGTIIQTTKKGTQYAINFQT